MSKTKNISKEHESLEHDFTGDMPANEAMLSIIKEFTKASDMQLKHSIDLTRLIVENIEQDSLTTDDIITIFEDVSEAVSEKSPANKILEQM